MARSLPEPLSCGLPMQNCGIVDCGIGTILTMTILTSLTITNMISCCFIRANTKELTNQSKIHLSWQILILSAPTARCVLVCY